MVAEMVWVQDWGGEGRESSWMFVSTLKNQPLQFSSAWLFDFFFFISLSYPVSRWLQMSFTLLRALWIGRIFLKKSFHVYLKAIELPFKILGELIDKDTMVW